MTVVLFVGLAGCSGGKSDSAKKPEKTSPSKVEAHPSESDIYRVTLTPQAVDRLGITDAKVELKKVPRSRSLGGVVMTPPGQSLIIAAPVTGRVEMLKEGVLPQPGSQLTLGDPLLILMPMLSPERYVPTPAERIQIANAEVALASAKINAEGDVERAQAEFDAAKIAHDRAKQLLADKAGSARAVDDALGILNVTQKTLDAATNRKAVLDALTLKSEAGEAQPVPILAPDSGTLMNVFVTRGQTVTMGASLFEIADMQTMWIRVPVYAGQLDEIQLKQPVKVWDLQDENQSTSLTATHVDAPPTGDPLAASVDLYYQIENPTKKLRPGQRVRVQLTLTGDSENLVVPLAAVLYDTNGTAWVYGRDEETVFRRHRVLVKHSGKDPETNDDIAVLEYGPPVGTKVVVNGVAELFGTEFGTGK